VSPGVRVVSSTVVDSAASDHRPVRADPRIDRVVVRESRPITIIADTGLPTTA
jgi:hypothetical protein